MTEFYAKSTWLKAFLASHDGVPYWRSGVFIVFRSVVKYCSYICYFCSWDGSDVKNRRIKIMQDEIGELERIEMVLFKNTTTLVNYRHWITSWMCVQCYFEEFSCVIQTGWVQDSDNLERTNSREWKCEAFKKVYFVVVHMAMFYFSK